MRTRLYVAIAVVAVFLVAGGVLIFVSSGGGGAARTIDVAVTGDQMKPSTLTAKQGDKLTINITADRAGEVHLHGYEIHFEGKAGEVRTQTFKADKSGHFEIEFEATSTKVGELVVNP